jgi:hypothetical protein
MSPGLPRRLLPRRKNIQATAYHLLPKGTSTLARLREHWFVPELTERLSAFGPAQGQARGLGQSSE